MPNAKGGRDTDGEVIRLTGREEGHKVVTVGEFGLTLATVELYRE